MKRSDVIGGLLIGLAIAIAFIPTIGDNPVRSYTLRELVSLLVGGAGMICVIVGRTPEP